MGEICTTGLWVDTETNQVVDSEPVEGHLLVPKGAEMTPNVKDQVERARARAPRSVAAETVEADESTERSDDAAPETSSVEGAAETAAATGRTGAARKR